MLAAPWTANFLDLRGKVPLKKQAEKSLGGWHKIFIDHATQIWELWKPS
jgi:hypothetical protein